jgi:hypothetical protein
MTLCYSLEDAPGLQWVGEMSLRSTFSWLGCWVVSVGGAVVACSSSEILSPDKTLQQDTAAAIGCN